MAKTLLLLGLASAVLTLGGATLAADIPEACDSYKAAVTGGPLPPPESDTVIIRWLADANFEFAYWYEQTRRAVATLANSGELTELGEPFVERLAATLREWCAETVPSEIARTVDDLLLGATVDWRLRNYVLADGETTRLAEAWSAGRDCGLVQPPVLRTGAAPESASRYCNSLFT